LRKFGERSREISVDQIFASNLIPHDYREVTHLRLSNFANQKCRALKFSKSVRPICDPNVLSLHFEMCFEWEFDLSKEESATPPSWSDDCNGQSDPAWDVRHAEICEWLEAIVLDSGTTPKKKVIFVTPQYPNEIESRRVMISHIHAQTNREELEAALSKFGEVASIWFDAAEHCAAVKFYNLKDAHDLRREGIRFHDRICFVAFGPTEAVADKKNPPNNGSIIVGGIGAGVADETVEEVFEAFGEVREVRGCPGKPSQRFVEFWDQKAAERAVLSLNKKMVSKLDGRLWIQYSRPGGFLQNITGLERNRVPTVKPASNRCVKILRKAELKPVDPLVPMEPIPSFDGNAM
jgi:hypothetical protein